MSNSITFYMPLVLLAVGYAVLTVAGRVLEGRPGRADAGSSLQTFGFALLLLAALYVAGLLVFSVITFPVTLTDFVVILATIFLFFGILIGALAILTEIRVGGRPVGVYFFALLLIALAALIVI